MGRHDNLHRLLQRGQSVHAVPAVGRDLVDCPPRHLLLRLRPPDPHVGSYPVRGTCEPAGHGGDVLVSKAPQRVGHPAALDILLPLRRGHAIGSGLRVDIRPAGPLLPPRRGLLLRNALGPRLRRHPRIHPVHRHGGTIRPALLRLPYARQPNRQVQCTQRGVGGRLQVRPGAAQPCGQVDRRELAGLAIHARGCRNNLSEERQ